MGQKSTHYFQRINTAIAAQISYSCCLADIRTATDYSPFGVELKGRNFKKALAKNYRFGFQGQEGDDEIKGDGNSVNYKYRMHDPRLGRFFAVDPLYAKYPANSVYAFSENQVTNMVELEGLEAAEPAAQSNSTTTTPASSTQSEPAKTNFLKVAPAKKGLEFTVGTQLMKSFPGFSGNGSDPSSGKPLGIGFGAEHYNTISKFPLSLENGKNDLSETNHQFGVGYNFKNGVSVEVMYSKQKVRGNNASGINMEAPGSILLSSLIRITGPKGIVGLSGGVGAGPVTGVMRSPNWHGDFKVLGAAAGVTTKIDASFVGISVYARVSMTVYHIASQETPSGKQEKREYGILSATAGVSYTFGRKKK